MMLIARNLHMNFMWKDFFYMTTATEYQTDFFGCLVQNKSVTLLYYRKHFGTILENMGLSMLANYVYYVCLMML